MVGSSVAWAAWAEHSNGAPKAPPSTSAPQATATSALALAQALQQQYVRVVQAVRPSVVEISSASGLGSGLVYDTRGDIVTNAHVVGNEANFTVSFSDGRSAAGRLVGSYPPDDLAVIKVPPITGLKPAQFGDSAKLQVGTIVLAIGNPLGLSSSVTDGIVSFNGRTLDEGNGTVLPDLVQTSAPINPGNSGGALVDLSGRVVGIPTLAATSNGSAAPGLGFAIASNTVKLIAPQLVAKGVVTTAGRAAIGINATTAFNFSGEPIGVLVSEVRPSGPAAKAGIVAGDLITAVNNTPTRAATELQEVLAQLKPGSRVTVSVTNQSGQEKTLSVVLADLAQL